MLIGAAVFARPVAPARLVAALAGGLAPDVPMFIMVLWSTRVLGQPERKVFGESYYSDAWQAVFAIDHGLLTWGALLAFALLRRRLVLRVFAGSGLLHAFADLLTHHDDARRQFWPMTDWVFRSPVSYWDARYFGNVFAVFEVGLVAVLAAYLCWNRTRTWERAVVLFLAALMVVPVVATGGFHGLHGMG